MSCSICKISRAIILRPKDSTRICKECFFEDFESEIHKTIITNKLIEKGDKMAICVSGGKDSTVLAHILYTLNNRYSYGAELFLLSIDEGIKGYRDCSLEIVKKNKNDYNLNLKIISFSTFVGLTMDQIYNKTKSNNCTYCGVFRRRAIENGALSLGCNKIATGHNADDLAETVILNLIRGDSNRFFSCTEAKNDQKLSRIKPLKYSYEKEIVMYAFHKKLPYFSTECTYSHGSHRGFVRTFIKEMERIDSKIIINIIKTAEMYQKKRENVSIFKCNKCGENTTSKGLCMMCMLLEKLN